MKRTTRSIKKLTTKIINSIARVFNPAKNSTYRSLDLAKTLIQICKNESSAERRSKPSPDTILRRLHQTSENQFNQILEELNAELLSKLDLPKRPVIALDYTTKPYYGEEQPTLVSDPNLPGTNLGIRFANLSIVEKGKTYTLKTRQVGPFTSNERIVKEMLEYTERFVEPRIILLDRGFYSVKVIKLLKSRKQDFIMPAKRTGPVKRLCKKFKEGEISPMIDYTIKSSDDSARVKLVFIKRKTEKGVEIHPFISNLELEPREIARLYGWRWRIETNNRELERFSALTTSTSMKIRRLYYSLAALLYNLWIVVRGGSELPRAHQFKRILNSFLWLISAEIKREPRPPPNLA